jgi:hypothetical protein
MKTVVNVAYSVPGQFGTNPKLDKQLRTIAATFKGESLGSGSGFGQRDTDFEFPTKTKATAFVKEVTVLPKLIVCSL